MKVTELKKGDLIDGDRVIAVEDLGFFVKVYTDGTHPAFPGAQKAVWCRPNDTVDEHGNLSPWGANDEA